jgi:L-alanine-DL-glutamate epimerase-like enolase superfamily enzyme
MRIAKVEPFILHVPVTGSGISDSLHTLSHWGAPGVVLTTDDGQKGYGYSGTHAHLPGDRLIAQCIGECYGPKLIGRDAREVGQIWHDLYRYPPMQWIGRGGIAHLALGAIDIALWDLKAKAAGEPLWRLLGGGATKKLVAYDTDGGWLSLSLEALVAGTKSAVDRGFNGVKIKVGSANLDDDLRRLEAVRKAIGPKIKLMVDANGRYNLAEARRLGRHLADYDVIFFEEPMWYDDIEGHARLAREIATPVALGEQLYLVDQFKAFFAAGAVQFAQPDVVRLAGITEWWQVADMALAHRLPVVPHVGDMMQIHLHTAIAHPACTTMEHIPWLRACFEEPASVKDGYFVIPQQPGAGTTFKPDTLAKFGVR